MIQEFERITLTTDIPEYGLKAADIGTVVDITGDKQYTIEFLTPDGETFAVVPVMPDQIRRLSHQKASFMAEVPTFEKFMNPVLEALRDLGGSGTIEEINGRVY